MTGHGSDGSYESPPVVLRKAELRCPPSPRSRCWPFAHTKEVALHTRKQKKSRAKHGSTNGLENRLQREAVASLARVAASCQPLRTTGCHWLSSADGVDVSGQTRT